MQNAEDNKYTIDQTPPYLRFNVYPGKIVIESNEDGFEENHVRAICRVGESTKTGTGSKGYIGEKGIGFKSVFKIAKQVWIQSGAFSFSFHHSRDANDHGLGMITPMDEAYDDLPEHIRTRMTLRLLDSIKFETAVQELNSLPNTLLLFLSRLKSLQLNIYPEDSPSVETSWSVSPCEKGIVTIKKTVRQGGQASDTKWRYIVTQKLVTGLPSHSARPGINEADVVIALPISEENTPLLAQQHVYSFLPLRRAGFNVSRPLGSQYSQLFIQHVCSGIYLADTFWRSSSFNPISSPRQAARMSSTALGILPC